jgi:hypothetical protein
VVSTSGIGVTLTGDDFRFTQGAGSILGGDITFSSVPATIVSGVQILSSNTIPVHPNILSMLMFVDGGGSGVITATLKGRNLLTHAPAFDIAQLVVTQSSGWFTPAVTPNGNSTGGTIGLLPFTKTAEIGVWVEITATSTANLVGGVLVGWSN